MFYVVPEVPYFYDCLSMMKYKVFYQSTAPNIAVE